MATKKRTTKTQLSIYLQYLDEHRQLMVHGRLQPHNSPDDLENLWNELTSALNCCGDGPVRTPLEWKKVFTEWKSLVRKKARELKLLNDIEKKFINITGAAAVVGINKTDELGIQTEQNLKVMSRQENMDDIEEGIEGDSEGGAIEENENIVIEVVQDGPRDGPKKKRTRTTTNDVLTNAYREASIGQAESLDHIANAILEVAAAINRMKLGSFEHFISDSRHVGYLQYEMYLNYLAQKRDDFEELCGQLNASGGPIKSVKQWQKCFWNWTSTVKRKARKIYLDQEQTGGGPPLSLILTVLEKKLLELLGQICVEGMQVKELGLIDTQRAHFKLEPTKCTTKQKVTFCSATKSRIEKRIIHAYQSQTKINKSLRGVAQALQTLSDTSVRLLKM